MRRESELSDWRNVWGIFQVGNVVAEMSREMFGTREEWRIINLYVYWLRSLPCTVDNTDRHTDF